MYARGKNNLEPKLNVKKRIQYFKNGYNESQKGKAEQNRKREKKRRKPNSL